MTEIYFDLDPYRLGLISLRSMLFRKLQPKFAVGRNCEQSLTINRKSIVRKMRLFNKDEPIHSPIARCSMLNQISGRVVDQSISRWKGTQQENFAPKKGTQILVDVIRGRIKRNRQDDRND